MTYISSSQSLASVWVRRVISIHAGADARNATHGCRVLLETSILDAPWVVYYPRHGERPVQQRKHVCRSGVEVVDDLRDQRPGKSKLPLM